MTKQNAIILTVVVATIALILAFFTGTHFYKISAQVDRIESNAIVLTDELGNTWKHKCFNPHEGPQKDTTISLLMNNNGTPFDTSDDKIVAMVG